MNLFGLFTGTSWAKWAVYGVGAATMVGCVWFAYLWAYDRGVASQTDKVTQAKEAEFRAVDANRTNEQAIKTLQDANDECVARAAANRAEASKLAGQIQAKQDEQTRVVTIEHAERKVLYEKAPTLKACAAMQLPPAIASQLRQ